MLMELGYWDYTQGVQRQCSIQGYPVNGIMIFNTIEAVETNTYVTVRTPQGTLVERINLDYLHQISDFHGGNSDDDTASSPAFVYINLGLVSLGDNDELRVIIDCESADATPIKKIGVGVVVDDLPEHDELIYQYSQHNDGSFNVDAASGLYVFASSIVNEALLINVKLGEDTMSTTFRATNWFANLAGKIELDNTTMGVVFDNALGMPCTVNHSHPACTAIVRKVVQVDEHRRRGATQRIARQVARRFDSLDSQSKRAIP